MARRRKIMTKKRTKRGSYKKNTNGPKKLMLAMNRLDSFRFNLKETLTLVEGGDALYANILSKYSNLGFDEASSYLEEQLETGNLQKEKHAEILEIMKRYSKYR